MEKIEVSFSEFEKLSGIPTRTLYNWQKEGILPKAAAKGKHDLQTLLPKVIQHFREEVLDDCDQLRAERIKETTERARKLKLQNDETEGQLCRADGVVATWAAAFTTCKSRFMGLAVTLVDDLAGITDQAIAKEIIQDSIQEILEELGSGAILTEHQKAELKEANYQEM